MAKKNKKIEIGSTPIYDGKITLTNLKGEKTPYKVYRVGTKKVIYTNDYPDGMTFKAGNGATISIRKPVEKKVSYEPLNKPLPGKTNSKKPVIIKKPAVRSNKKGVVPHKKATEPNYSNKVTLTKDQEKALELLESGENVFLSGEAGTGKSYVLNEFVKRNRKKKNIIVCAFTGIAAINVNGSTIHRVFDMPIGVLKPDDYNKDPDDALIKSDVIIIDEISMCRFDHFEYVVRTLRRAEELDRQKRMSKSLKTGSNINWNTGKQIVVVGDFYQLPPVITKNDREVLEKYYEGKSIGHGFAFQSPLWKEADFKSVVLKEILRQNDRELLTNLNKIRSGDASGITYFNSKTSEKPIPGGIYLCGRNAAADKVNQEKSEALDGDTKVYKAEIKGEVGNGDKMNLGDEIALKVGMQVMTVINNDDEGFQNGSLGIVDELKDKSVIVRLYNGSYVEVKPHDFEVTNYEVQEDVVERVVIGNFKQIPLKIAYAITIHKSQGQTYTSANISPDCFDVGQLYVALSRVQTIEGMHLTHKIAFGALRTSNEVVNFYNAITGNKDIDSGTDVATEHKQVPIEEDNHMVTAPRAEAREEVKKEDKSEDDYFDYLFQMAKDIN